MAMKKTFGFLQTLFLICAFFMQQSLWAKTGADTAPQDSKTSVQSSADEKNTSGKYPGDEITKEQKNKTEKIEQMHQTLQMIGPDENTTGEIPESEMTEEQKKKKKELEEEQEKKKEEIEQMRQTLEMIRSVQNTTKTLRAAKVKVPKRS